MFAIAGYEDAMVELIGDPAQGLFQRDKVHYHASVPLLAVEHQTNDVRMTVQPSAFIMSWNEMASGELDAGIASVDL
jgi:hypothetical protein